MAKNLIARKREQQAQRPEDPVSPYLRLYGLRDNPFPSMALFVSSTNDPRTNGEIYDAEFRRDEEKAFFERFVLPPTGDKPLPIGFVRLDPQAGGRGNGKSTFLHHLMVRINTATWGSWPADPDDSRLTATAVHLLPEPKKQNNFFELIRLIFETLYRTEFATPGRPRLVRKLDAEIRAALLLDVLSGPQADEIAGRPAEVIAEMLESSERFGALLTELGVSRSALVAAAESRLGAISSTCLDNEFIKAFLAKGMSIEAVWGEWKRNGWAASDNRWKRWGGEWLADGLVPVLIMAGQARLYVLLDEFEKIYVYQTSRKREEFLDLLRQVFYEQDSAAVRRQYITTVLSIHPSIETYLKNHWARVGLHQLAPLAPGEVERISVPLGKSTEKRLSHLMVTYLDHYRDAGAPHHGEPYPFAPGALSPAMDAARLYPRDTLQYAHMILKKAASESIAAPIQKTYVEAFLTSAPAQRVDEEDDFSALGASETKLTDD